MPLSARSVITAGTRGLRHWEDLRVSVREAVKRLIVGGRLEAPVKRLHYSLTRSRNSLYDAQAIAVMERVLRTDSIAADIGAFEGGFLRHMIRLAPGARHYAFEPLPARFERLRVTFPKQRVLPFALGKAPGSATFYEVLGSPALSGLRPRADAADAHAVRQIQVQVETLDRVIDPADRLAFIKIDVEGGELDVLRGGVETFRRSRPAIVFECGIGGLDLYGEGPGDVYDFVVNSMGLHVSLLAAWLRRDLPLSRGEFIQAYERRGEFYFIAHPSATKPRA